MAVWKSYSLLITCIALQNLIPSTTSAAAPKADDDLTVDKANEYIAQNKQTVDQTYRLKYHSMAPIGWINDPNGFIQFRGEYHLFYQYNPYGTLSNRIHWGHAKSKDLVHWEDLPVALAPDQDYDREGVFSGSAIEKDGKLYVMYTGHTSTAQVQCIAVSEDGIHFEKVPENPVLDAEDLPSNAQPQDFRDPKVFKRGDLYYVVLVSKTTDETGQVLLYESPDLINWTFKSIMLEGNKQQGIMWECPDLFELDGKDVLIQSLIQIPRDGNHYHNLDSVVEFIGKVDWETGKFTVENIKETDHGMDFYATQTLLDDKNRRIGITWMNMWGRSFPTHDLGHKWTGGMTLPRQLNVKNGKLVQTPVTEIASTYTNTLNLSDVTLTNEPQELNGVVGDAVILELVVNLSEATLLTIDLRANGNEKTVLSYDTVTEEVILDRTNSGITIIGEEQEQVLSRKVVVPLEENKLKLQIFVDVSSVEVFVNDGVESFTTTVYPTVPNANRIRFAAEGSAIIENLSFSQIQLTTTEPNTTTNASQYHGSMSKLFYLVLTIFILLHK